MTIVICVFNIKSSLYFDSVADFLISRRANFSFILINCDSQSFLRRSLKEKFVRTYSVDFKKSFLGVPGLIKLRRIIKAEKSDVLEYHGLHAAVSASLASLFLRISHKIYFRHHTDYNRIYFRHAVKYDKLVSFLSTSVCVPSESLRDYLVKEENVCSSKVFISAYALKLDNIYRQEEELRRTLRSEYGVPKDSFVVGLVSRFDIVKGLQFSLPALIKLQKKYSNICILMCNGSGPYEQKLKTYIENLDSSRLFKIDYFESINHAYNIMDVFVHTPISESAEAFGMVYVESYQARVPSVITLSGIASEIYSHRINCLVADYQNSDSVFKQIEAYYEEEGLLEKIQNALSKDDISIKFTAEARASSQPYRLAVDGQLHQYL